MATGLPRAYGPRFIPDVYRLIEEGHRRLDPSALSGMDEEVISQRLGEAMEAITQDEDWAVRYHVHIERPVGHQRTGKRRPRLDLDVEKNRRSPGQRPRFPIEAKRLGGGYGTDDYLGREGLECFMNGTYAPTQPVAGMLGYVQADEPSYWAGWIAKGLAKSTYQKTLCLEERTWTRRPHPSSSMFCYESDHARPGCPIRIHHILLLCRTIASTDERP